MPLSCPFPDPVHVFANNHTISFYLLKAAFRPVVTDLMRSRGLSARESGVWGDRGGGACAGGKRRRDPYPRTWVPHSCHLLRRSDRWNSGRQPAIPGLRGRGFLGHANVIDEDHAGAALHRRGSYHRCR